MTPNCMEAINLYTVGGGVACFSNVYKLSKFHTLWVVSQPILFSPPHDHNWYLYYDIVGFSHTANLIWLLEVGLWLMITGLIGYE